MILRNFRTKKKKFQRVSTKILLCNRRKYKW